MSLFSKKCEHCKYYKIIIIFALLFYNNYKAIIFSVQSMTNEEKVTYWIDLSDEDLRAGATMLAGGHYLYVGFICHQCIEKIFKAAYEYRINGTPPYIHDLMLIAKKAGIFEIFNEEQIDFIERLSPLNIRARYPDYKKSLAKELTKAVCKNYIDETQKLQQWTKEKILLIK